MKIGIESQRIFRRTKHGMDVVAMELIRKLQELDTINQYTLFAKAGPVKTGIAETGNFRFKLIRGASYADWEQISLPLSIRKIKPDIIHCTANTAPLICPAPLILTLHDVIFLNNTGFGGSAYQNFGNIYRKMVVPHAIRQARKIITVSENEKKIITEKCRLDPDKITVIHNAADERFHPGYKKQELAHFRERHHLPEQFILHLGNTAPKKNTPMLIKAYVHYCSNVTHPLPIVVADYPPCRVVRLLEEIRRPELIGMFCFPGYIPAQEMPLLYNCSSLFIYPSLQESFGLPLLEAMCCGIPVIASQIPAFREVAGNAVMFFNPENHESIAESVQLMLNNTQMQEENIRKGLIRARLFGWKNSAEKLLEVYQTTSMASP